MWLEIFQDFSDLTPKEQLKLFNVIKEDLFPEPKADISNFIGEVRETRFSKGGSVYSLRKYVCKKKW